MREYSIGEAARESGIRVGTIRFYEARGLLPAPPRSDGNRRLYDGAALARLRFIRHGRDLGFSLDAIAELLALQDNPDQPCRAADRIAARQLAEVEHRIARLQALRSELQRISTACTGESTAACRVIESLADHSLCRGDHRAE